MNRNDLIQRIDAKLNDNGTITFNVPFSLRVQMTTLRTFALEKYNGETEIPTLICLIYPMTSYLTCYMRLKGKLKVITTLCSIVLTFGIN